MAEGLRKQALFGGNMSILLPNNAVDISEIREIPDNQEVFTHNITDQSVIIEILEMVAEPDDQAMRTHFQELASSNDAQDCSQIALVDPIPSNQLSLAESERAYFLSGQQQIAKFNESAKNTVSIHMGLFRLPAFATDIIVTFNDPQVISPQSSSNIAVAEGAPQHDAWTLQQFRASLQSLTMQDSSFLG